MTATGCRAGVPRPPPRGGWPAIGAARDHPPGRRLSPLGRPAPGGTYRGALSGLFFSGLELGLELLLDVGGHRVVVAELDGVRSLARGYGLELGLIVVELA